MVPGWEGWDRHARVATPGDSARRQDRARKPGKELAQAPSDEHGSSQKVSVNGTQSSKEVLRPSTVDWGRVQSKSG